MMPIERVQREVGSKMTAVHLAYDEVTWTSPADSDVFNAAMENYNASFETLWGLNKAALDALGERLAEIEGDVAQRLVDDPKAYYALFVERESEAWYLREIACARLTAESAIREGGITGVNAAVQAALRVGYWWAEARMKFTWEPHAMRGLNTLERAVEGGKAKSNATKVRDADLLRKYSEKLEAGVKRPVAIARLAKEFGLGVPRIRQLVRGK